MNAIKRISHFVPCEILITAYNASFNRTLIIAVLCGAVVENASP